jgi:hypothetical protein
LVGQSSNDPRAFHIQGQPTVDIGIEGGILNLGALARMLDQLLFCTQGNVL